MGCPKLHITEHKLLPDTTPSSPWKQNFKGSKNSLSLCSSFDKICAGSYRFGFNGMEMDDEVKGTGNHYTTQFRQYDPRIGRWFSIDPLVANFPWQSPYVAFDNSPIAKVDTRGDAAGDPDKLTKAAEDAVKEVENTYGLTTAQCNRGVRLAVKNYTGKDLLSPSVVGDGSDAGTDKGQANDMADYLEGSKDWEAVDVGEVQELANKGEVVVAVYKTSGSGHVALAVPGEAATSGTWNYESAKTLEGGIPQLMDTGYKKRTTSQSANYSFRKSKQKDVVFYRYKPAISTTNEKKVRKTVAKRSKTKTKSTESVSSNNSAKESKSAFKAVGQALDNFLMVFERFYYN